MRNMVKRTAAGAVLGGSLLVTGGLGIANALPDDQLVDLQIGNGQVLSGLNVDVASQIAGLLCGTGANVTGTAETETNPDGTPATGMSAESPTNTTQITTEIRARANQVDASQIPTTTCTSSQGVVTISQNGAVTTPNTANTRNTPESSPTSAIPGEQDEGTAPSPAASPAPAGTLGPAPTG